MTDAPHRVDITALDSTVFERLESSWVFTETVPPRGGGRVVTHVKFEVEYAVNSMAASVIDSLFGDIAAKQMRAFKQQCARRYGAPLRRQRRGPAGSAGSAGSADPQGAVSGQDSALGLGRMCVAGGGMDGTRGRTEEWIYHITAIGYTYNSYITADVQRNGTRGDTNTVAVYSGCLQWMY